MKKILVTIFLSLITIIGLCIVYLMYLNNQAEIISEGSKIPEYDTVKSTLLVIDIQEATTGNKGTEQDIQKGLALINNVNEIIQHADSNNVLIIYIYTESSNWFLNLLNDSMEKGSFGTQLDSRLNVVSENILSKEKLDSFSNPKLDSVLTENKINTIYFAGLDAAYCVNSTIEAAQNRSYKTVVIKDAVISGTEELLNEMLEKFNSKGVRIINKAEYLQSKP